MLVTIQIKSPQQYFYMVPFISSDFTKIKSIFCIFFFGHCEKGRVDKTKVSERKGFDAQIRSSYWATAILVTKRGRVKIP